MIPDHLTECYGLATHEWRSNCPNPLKWTKEVRILELIYDGRRLREIKRQVSTSKVTINAVKERLFNYLSNQSTFPIPCCKCGRTLWHKGICPVWDNYHSRAIRKGHQTQSKQAQQRYADAFFEMSAFEPKLCACGCGQITTLQKHQDKVYGLKPGEYRNWVHGHWALDQTRKRLERNPDHYQQYQRQKAREKLAQDIWEFCEWSKVTDLEVVFRHFQHRGFNKNAISKIIRTRQINQLIKTGTSTELINKTETQREQNDFFFVAHQMTVTLSKTDVAKQAERFTSLVQQGIDAWTEAGRILVEMLESNPGARTFLLEQYPDLTEEILARFEAIGRKQIHPKTLLNNSPGMRRLRQLPFSEQEKYLSEPVPVLIRTQSGVDQLNVSIKNLTSQQACQVLTRNGVRSLEAQRAWIESRKPHRKNVSAYEIKNGKVIFHEDCEMTAKELAELLARLS